MKHTPNLYEVVVTAGGEVWIETRQGSWFLGRGAPEEVVNLIAAAPELLEALQVAISELEVLYSVYETVDKQLQPQDALVLKRLQAAIAKATGEGE